MIDIKKTLELHAAWRLGDEGGERADLSGANLSGANLYRANLSGANLSGADLSGANLSSAKDAFQFGPMPTSGRICVAIRHPEGWKVKAGCFFDYLPLIEKRVKESHNCPAYLGMIEVLKKM